MSAHPAAPLSPSVASVPAVAERHRPARARDLLAVQTIYTHAEVLRFLDFDPQPLWQFVPVFHELLRGGDFFVYERGGTLVGCYRARRDGADAAALECVAVRPAHQGRGIGQAMLGQALQRLRSEGVRRVTLSVESDNPRALRLYQRLGFVIEATEENFYTRPGAQQPVHSHGMGLRLDG